LRPSTSTLGGLKRIRHDRNTAIWDMKGGVPFVAYERATAARMAGSAWRSPVTRAGVFRFGQDRLVILYLATQAVRDPTREVRFRSGADLLVEWGRMRDFLIPFVNLSVGRCQESV
jgi:hypothetical protein